MEKKNTPWIVLPEQIFQKISELEIKTEKKVFLNEQSNLWENFKESNTHVLGSPKERELEQKKKKGRNNTLNIFKFDDKI